MDRIFERAQLVRVLGDPLTKKPNDLPVRIVTDAGVDVSSSEPSLLRWDCYQSDTTFGQMLDTIASDDQFTESREGVMDAVSTLETTFSCVAENVVGELWRLVHCCPRHRARIAALSG